MDEAQQNTRLLIKNIYLGVTEIILLGEAKKIADRQAAGDPQAGSAFDFESQFDENGEVETAEDNEFKNRTLIAILIKKDMHGLAHYMAADMLRDIKLSEKKKSEILKSITTFARNIGKKDFSITLNDLNDTPHREQTREREKKTTLEKFITALKTDRQDTDENTKALAYAIRQQILTEADIIKIVKSSAAAFNFTVHLNAEGMGASRQKGPYNIITTAIDAGMDILAEILIDKMIKSDSLDLREKLRIVEVAAKLKYGSSTEDLDKFVAQKTNSIADSQETLRQRRHSALILSL